MGRKYQEKGVGVIFLELISGWYRFVETANYPKHNYHCCSFALISEDVPLHCHTTKHYLAFEVELLLGVCRVPGRKKSDYICQICRYLRMFLLLIFKMWALLRNCRGCRDPIYGIKLAPPLEIYHININIILFVFETVFDSDFQDVSIVEKLQGLPGSNIWD